ncbi:LytR/AlgR family response regulator transcription factor [Paenibacillus chitinolyticus]|uniref:LytR/AlgR family response regulator transcription factor n=1 Tax=Paenibacillus chitinolyticus TaxID=79263 RepID=UPI00295E5F5F|nr:LytTR family DNA-binding domain-containing protein [Paenibacillus chitinolyticus]
MEEKLTVLIAEDDPIQRDKLLLYADKMNLDIIGTVSSGTRLINEYLEHRPDLVLLDIGLEKLDGISAFKAITEQGFRPQMIFVTGSSNPYHLLMGYELDSVDYITKPVNFERFERAISKAKKNILSEKLMATLNDKKINMITVKYKKRTITLNEDQIVCAEKVSIIKQIRIYTVDGRIIETTTPLSKILEQCTEYVFCPHRSYLVNYKYITSVVPDDFIAGNYIINLLHCDLKVQLYRNNYDRYLACKNLVLND